MDGLEHGSGLHAGITRTAQVVRRMMVPVVGALALWGAAPAVASTQAGWHLSGKPLTESIATGWKGKLKLTDAKVPFVGSVTVECEDAAEGSSGAGGVGAVTAWTTSKCAAVKGCEKTGAVVVKPLNLPWHTELVTVEGTVRDVLVSGGKGTPGYEVECKVTGSLPLQDECTGTLSTTTTNTESGVTAAFNASEKLNCTLGGSGSGSLEGSQSILAGGGGKLSAEAEGPLTWLGNGVSLAEANAISWKGTLTLSDSISTIGTVAVECEDTGSGTAGPVAAGEMTKWTMSNCAGTAHSSCEGTGETIEALHLPWHTELAYVEGRTREVITANGKGTPGFKLKCKALGSNITDECVAVPSTNMTNTKSGVTAAFDGERFTCSLGRAGAGELEGSQAIELAGGRLLQVS